MKAGKLSTEDPIVQRLSSVAGTNPDLRAAARLYEAILPLIRDADIHLPPLHTDPAMVRACLEKGVPLLSGLDLEVEFRELEELMLRLVRAVESIDTSGEKQRRWKVWQRTPDTKGADDQAEYRLLKAAAAGIRQAYENGTLDLGDVLSRAAGGDHDGVAEKAGVLQLDTRLLWTLAQNALKAPLHIFRREIEPLAAGQPWDKGYCLICGAGATLGELQDNAQAKHLRCGQCGADWHFNRLQCLHCGNMDHSTQQNLYMEGGDSRRIEACDLCHGYLKVIASFAPTPPEMLAVEDLATLHLDFIARQKGYAKTGVSYDYMNNGRA